VDRIADTVTLEVLVSRLRAHLPDLSRRYQIASLGVFGSYVRGDHRSDSDLDLLVEFQEPPSLFQFIRLENELSDVLGIDVDLVMKSALKPAIGRQILEEVQAI
jgi:predicted nucleotidyltransferase